MQVWMIRRRRANSLPLARGRNRGLLLREGFRGRAATTKAKAKVSHPKMGDTSGLLASQGRDRVSCATTLDTLDGITLKGRDPRVMGHHSPNHQWDMHRHSLFLLTPTQVRGTSISPRVQHRHRLFHRQTREAKAWVEIGHKAHKSRLQGPRGVSTL